VEYHGVDGMIVVFEP
jgi:hypothetical protein